MTKRIPLTQSKYALVGDEDFDIVNKYNWYAYYSPYINDYYAATNMRNGNKRFTQHLHRFIWELHNGPIPQGLQIDHIYHNPLDNRINNLRLVTIRQNQQNRKFKISKYAGVCWHKRAKKWQAKITINGKLIHLGYFKSEYKAHLAYRKALAAIGEIFVDDLEN